MQVRRLGPIPLFFWVRWFHIKDYFYTIAHYYTNPWFALQDTFLLLLYFFESPYYISRRFFEKTGYKAASPYGETPYRMLEKIAKNIPITAHDVVYDLGCGRGRGCFWFGSILGCRVVGIEYNPVFMKKARFIQKLFGPSCVHFRQENMLDVNLEEATVVYLYCLTLADADIVRLAQVLQGLAKKPFIVTVSFSLNEYLPGAFVVLKELEVVFAWGNAVCYIQKAL